MIIHHSTLKICLLVGKEAIFSLNFDKLMAYTQISGWRGATSHASDINIPDRGKQEAEVEEKEEEEEEEQQD